MKNAFWIAVELDARGGPFASWDQIVLLGTQTVRLREGTIAEQVRHVACGSVTLAETVARAVSGEVGIWFHAGWIDQAVLDLSPVVKGDVRAAGRCFELLDRHPADQNGDMVVGFASLELDWVIYAQVSRERHRVTLSLRAADAPTMELVMQRLQPR